MDKYISPALLDEALEPVKNYIDNINSRLTAKDSEINGKVTSLESSVQKLESFKEDLEVPQAAESADIASLKEKFSVED